MTTPTGAADERERLISEVVEVQNYLNSQHGVWDVSERLTPVIDMLRADAKLAFKLYHADKTIADMHEQLATKNISLNAAEDETVRWRQLAEERGNLLLTAWDENAAQQSRNGELLAELERVRNQVKAMRECVPTSWLDDILTGPNAVIGEQPWGCPEVERILKAITKRMDALAIPSAAGGEKEE